MHVKSVTHEVTRELLAETTVVARRSSNWQISRKTEITVFSALTFECIALTVFQAWWSLDMDQMRCRECFNEPWYNQSCLLRQMLWLGLWLVVNTGGQRIHANTIKHQKSIKEKHDDESFNRPITLQMQLIYISQKPTTTTSKTFHKPPLTTALHRQGRRTNNPPKNPL